MTAAADARLRAHDHHERKEPTAAQPVTRAARHQAIVDILGSRTVRSQTELAEHLVEHGMAVTQGTLSRDLVELGAAKLRNSSGWLVYAVPGEGGDPTPRAVEDGAVTARLVRVCEEVLVSARSSANLVVLRTPPGAAQYLASAVDHATRPEILGTIAGDDTVLVIATDPDGGDTLTRWFLDLAEGRGASSYRTSAEGETS